MMVSCILKVELKVTVFVPPAITVSFDHMEHHINEDARVIHPLLVLSGPSSFFETVQIITVNSTANGMCMHAWTELKWLNILLAM